jgi:hypothetical protein
VMGVISTANILCGVAYFTKVLKEISDEKPQFQVSIALIIAPMWVCATQAFISFLKCTLRLRLPRLVDGVEDFPIFPLLCSAGSACFMAMVTRLSSMSEQPTQESPLRPVLHAVTT